MQLRRVSRYLSSTGSCEFTCSRCGYVLYLLWYNFRYIYLITKCILIVSPFLDEIMEFLIVCSICIIDELLYLWAYSKIGSTFACIPQCCKVTTTHGVMLSCKQFRDVVKCQAKRWKRSYFVCMHLLSAVVSSIWLWIWTWMSSHYGTARFYAAAC